MDMSDYHRQLCSSVETTEDTILMKIRVHKHVNVI